MAGLAGNDPSHESFVLRESGAYRSAAARATTFGIAVMVPILAIVFLMVVKPTL